MDRQTDEQTDGQAGWFFFTPPPKKKPVCRGYENTLVRTIGHVEIVHTLYTHNQNTHPTSFTNTKPICTKTTNIPCTHLFKAVFITVVINFHIFFKQFMQLENILTTYRIAKYKFQIKMVSVCSLGIVR